MKKSLLLVLVLAFASSISAQVIFFGESPLAIEGAYDLTWSEPSSNWGSPDLEDPANSVRDTLVMFESDSTACTAATNAGDLAGQIAVVYRADCQFGEKAEAAEAAGAIACVIINNIPGAPVGMDGGTSGPTVGIPVAMISDVDGAALVNEMANGAVVVFIGNKLGFFENDISLHENRVLRPEYSNIPSALAADGSEFPVQLAATISNSGVNEAKNVRLNAIISLNGTELYNDTSNAVDIPSGDTFHFTLPTYAPASWDEGYYELNYFALADSIDDSEFDNQVESDFVISPNSLSYASIDESTMLPNSTGGNHPIDGNGNPIPFYSSCIHFRNANASKLAPRSITFSALKGSDAEIPSMEGETIEIGVYEYNDVFTDIEDPGYEIPISQQVLLMSSEFIYPTDSSGKTITAEFANEDIFALEDNQRYIFCASTYVEEVYLGSNSDRDYTINEGEFKQPLFPIQAPAGTFDPRGFGASTVPSLMVNFIPAAQVGLDKEDLGIAMNAYPSPAAEVLNVDFNNHIANQVQLVDMTGKVVVSQNVNKNTKKTTLDLTGVENGVYLVNVRLDNNMTHTMRVVVSH
ncbi:T9SS type A sorting domain-containing protein [Brumimicrobium salinarum]|uniref:T9SS type A sorting domain-containing protein n=1 Tax=Brumimicrobium salinarum TaxID=2058658 RepID=UPI0013FD3DEB|nr:T9SS type A sorting domain-containing protein [Brumimicrobium salinarum]